MHRLFLAPEQIAQGKNASLTPEQTKYLGTVLRLEQGAVLEVFDGQGARYAARLEGARVAIGEKLPAPAARTADVILVQALSKGEKMDLVVQKATELGVSRIIPLAGDRSVVKLDLERGEGRAERFRRIAQEAARQCGRSDVPQIDAPATWQDLFALLSIEPGRRGLFLDPEEPGLRLGQAARGSTRLLLAVGPEGGFSKQERAQAVQAGLQPVGLGKLILRTETAALAALAIVQHVHGDLG